MLSIRDLPSNPLAVCHASAKKRRRHNKPEMMAIIIRKIATDRRITFQFASSSQMT